MIKQVLTNHVSEDTAYLVEDYPYGFRLRCKIRYWVEHKNNFGYRLVTQTTNPKTLVEKWNKPKPSGYDKIAGVLYLDENDHVKYAALGGYEKPSEILNFVKKFSPLPKEAVTTIKLLALAGKKYCAQKLAGEAYFTMNGQKIPATDEELSRAKQELNDWSVLSEELKAF